MTRLVLLVVMAMAMFTAGVFVFVRGRDLEEHILAGVAIVGSLAVVIANVTGNGKGDG